MSTRQRPKPEQFSGPNEIAEPFLDSSKSGSAADPNAKHLAIMFSIAWGYGRPIEVLTRALLEAHGRVSTELGVALDAICGEASYAWAD
jgi:hypothetical protein